MQALGRPEEWGLFQFTLLDEDSGHRAAGFLSWGLSGRAALSPRTDGYRILILNIGL